MAAKVGEVLEALDRKAPEAVRQGWEKTISKEPTLTGRLRLFWNIKPRST
jgi:hypothetical protein